MPNIKPVSDLRNYNEVLRDIAVGEPVLKLLGELSKGEQSARENGWTDINEVERMLGVKNG